MIAAMAYPFALIASALWFSAAFRYFSFQQLAAAKVLIPKTARDSPLFLTTAALARFLGGMNAGFALLSWVLVLLWATEAPFFSDPIERGVLLVVLAAAHFSQFIFNVPILRNGERRGESYWYVLSGPMFFIFAMDAAQTVINLIAGIAQFTV
jgi:hypothetical protein